MNDKLIQEHVNEHWAWETNSEPTYSNAGQYHAEVTLEHMAAFSEWIANCGYTPISLEPVVWVQAGADEPKYSTEYLIKEYFKTV